MTQLNLYNICSNNPLSGLTIYAIHLGCFLSFIVCPLSLSLPFSTSVLTMCFVVAMHCARLTIFIISMHFLLRLLFSFRIWLKCANELNSDLLELWPNPINRCDKESKHYERCTAKELKENQLTNYDLANRAIIEATHIEGILF